MSHPQWRRFVYGRFLASCGMITIAMLLSSCGPSTPSAGQPAETPDGWGYVDKSGKTVIAMQFHSAGPFVGAIAPARASYAIQRKGEGTYGFIDRAGRWVIPPIFDAVTPAIDAHNAPPAVVHRTATFRNTRYTVNDAGDLMRGGKPVTPDDIAAEVFIKETQADDLLVRMGAHRGLGRLATPRAMAALAKTPVNCGWQETTAAAQGREQVRRGAGVEYLIGVMGGKEAERQEAAFFALLMLCRDEHAQSELRTRLTLLPEKYHLAFTMRYGMIGDDEEPDPSKRQPTDLARARLHGPVFNNVPLELILTFFDEVQGGRSSRAFGRGFSTINIAWGKLAAVGVTRETMVRSGDTDAQARAALDEIFLNIRSTVPLEREGGFMLSAVHPMPTPDELIAWGERAKIVHDCIRRQEHRDKRDAKTYPMTAKRLAGKLPRADFSNVPLHLVVDFVREVSGLWIHVDWSGLGKMGIAKETEITIRRMDIAHGRLLRDVLDQAVGAGTPLGSCLVGGGMIIAPEQRLAGLRKKLFPRMLGRGAKDDPLTRKLQLKVPPAKAARMSLAAALQHVCKKAEVSLVVDWDGLKPLGVTEDQSVDITWLAGRTVAEALELLFSEIATGGTVGLAQKKGYVMVTRVNGIPEEATPWWELLR